MNLQKITVILFCTLISSLSFAQINDSNQRSFLDCKITYIPSLTVLEIKQFNESLKKNCSDFFEVDNILKADEIDFEKLNSPLITEAYRPSIQNVFSVPTFQIGDYNAFENGFRFKNPAFYEANRSSVLSFGYQTFPSSIGGVNF